MKEYERVAEDIDNLERMAAEHGADSSSLSAVHFSADGVATVIHFGLPDAEIARRSGLSRFAVARLRTKLGIPKHSNVPPGFFQKLVQLASPDVSTRSLARLTGVHPETVARYRTELGLPQYEPPVHVIPDGFMELHQRGEAAREIAQIMGVSTRQVERWRKWAGISTPKAPSPFTPEALETCRMLLEDGASIPDVAATIGASEMQVRRRFPQYKMGKRESGERSQMVRRLNAIKGLTS